MNEVIIRILDSSNSVLGDLDLKSFNDFPLVITKGIVNLDNLKARTGSYSKSFKVPNTKNNSKLLNSLDDINSRKDYNSALNRKECVIIVNGSIIDKGFVQVSKVYQGFELDSFELVFFGNNIDWVKQAAQKKLQDISWRNNSQVYNQSGITTANSATVSTYDHCFPYISRGGNEADYQTQVRDFYPCFYIKAIIERGLNDEGWNVSSSFLDDANIKTLVCDFANNMRIAQSVVDASKSRAELTSKITSSGAGRIIFQDDSTPPNSDANGNYDNATGYYTAPSSGKYIFEVSLTLNPINFGGRSTLAFDVIIATSLGAVYGAKVNQSKTITVNGQVTATWELTATLSAGESISVYYDWTQIFSEQVEIIAGSYFNFYRATELAEGDSYTLSEIIPDDYKLLDVINDFTRMFNIYYWTDVRTKTIYLEPRNTFFESEANAIDWTDKIDLSNKYELDYVSSYKRSVEFSYKDLSSDEWLKGWESNNKRKYGEYTHTLPNRFAEGTTSIKLDLFSAPYAHVANEVTYLENGTFNKNLAFTTLKVWNEYINTKEELQPEERITNYNPKIFFFKFGGQTSLDGTTRLMDFFGTSYASAIPYGIFEAYNNTDTPINLNFADSFKSDGSVDRGLFYNYYASMMKNIEEGGRLIAYFNLDNVDIENLDFRKLVYIDYPAQVKGYYLIESVIDYNPIKKGLTKVSLFKFENLGSVSIDTSQEGNNSVDTDNGNLPQPLEPIYVEDGSGNLIEVVIENPFNGWLYPVYK